MNGQQPDPNAQTPPPPLRIPKMQVVDSSHIAQAGHDPVQQSLWIAFHSGDIYAYSGVGTGTYQAMLAAESAGQFFNARIKGQYAATKIKDHRQKEPS
jgi:KTSC domain-containing protein